MKYKINELAQLLGVSSNSIRKYEDLGYIQPVRDEYNNYRYYDENSIETLFSIKRMRKYGFTHAEIEENNRMSLGESTNEYQQRLDKIDKDLEYLTSLRHRLKDDLQLLKRAQGSMALKEMENVPMLYILYKDGEKLLKEKERLDKLHEFMDKAPEMQRVMIISKDELLSEEIHFKSGWSVKEEHLEQYGIKPNEYTQLYPSMRSVMGVVKLQLDENNKFHSVHRRSELIKTGEDQFQRFFDYIDEHNYDIAGDAISIVIKVTNENGIKYMYLLHSIPIKERLD